MTVEREKLEAAIVNHRQDKSERVCTIIYAAIDAFAAAERLAEHVKTCEATPVCPNHNEAEHVVETCPYGAMDRPAHKCGQEKRHCPEAPIKESVS